MNNLLQSHYLQRYLANQTKSNLLFISFAADSLTADNASESTLFRARSAKISSSTEREDDEVEPVGDTGPWASSLGKLLTTFTGILSARTDNLIDEFVVQRSVRSMLRFSLSLLGKCILSIYGHKNRSASTYQCSLRFLFVLLLPWFSK